MATTRWSVIGCVCATALAALTPWATGWLAAQQSRPFQTVTDAVLQNPPAADWLMWRRTLNSWGYSPLQDITPTNVRSLRMVWTRALAPGLQEGTPLVHDGVMYFPNPLDVVEAIDAKTGDLKWQYRRKLPEDLGKFFPVPAINRNLAIYGNVIIDTSADDYVYALNAQTGALNERPIDEALELRNKLLMWRFENYGIDSKKHRN